MKALISHVKFQKEVEWLRPYLLAAATVIPAKKLTAVRGYKVPLDKDILSHGSCQTADFRRFTITLCTHNAQLESLGGKRFKAVRHNRVVAVNLLQTFAHELAHLAHWSHSPSHLALEVKITQRFIKVLEKQKVRELDVRKKLVPHVSVATKGRKSSA